MRHQQTALKSKKLDFYLFQGRFCLRLFKAHCMLTATLTLFDHKARLILYPEVQNLLFTYISPNIMPDPSCDCPHCEKAFIVALFLFSTQVQ